MGIKEQLRNYASDIITMASVAGIISGAMITAFTYFAKQEDLVDKYCRQQAESADFALDLQKAQHETIIALSVEMQNMVERLGHEDDKRDWKDAWRALEYAHDRSLSRLRNIPSHVHPDKIAECKLDPLNKLEINGILEKDNVDRLTEALKNY
jgi:hypothetical protein